MVLGVAAAFALIMAAATAEAARPPVAPAAGSLRPVGASLRAGVMQTVAASALLVPAVFARPVLASDDEGTLVVDPKGGFSVRFPAGWTRFEGRQPTPTMLKYQTEEVLLVGNSFVEGASMGVTKTNAPRLLQDFGVEWWFAPLEKISDVGSPALVADLLVLQRQGDFEKKQTPALIRTAAQQFDANDNSLLFEFDTPLAESVNRRTIAKAVFRPATGAKGGVASLYCLWISSLVSVMESDYRSKLDAMRDSFQVLERRTAG